jgi:hypothetical protein
MDSPILEDGEEGIFVEDWEGGVHVGKVELEEVFL